MAQAHKRFRLGNAECELITGITFSGTTAESKTHYLGAIPDVVVVIPTNKSYVVAQGGGTDTSSAFYLTAENASATCSALLIKAANPASLV